MPSLTCNLKTGECSCDGCREALPAAIERIAELEDEVGRLRHLALARLERITELEAELVDAKNDLQEVILEYRP